MINSNIVIISWWSNCLALRCIDHLSRHVNGQRIYCLQNGKSREGKARFSSLLDKQIIKMIVLKTLPGSILR